MMECDDFWTIMLMCLNFNWSIKTRDDVIDSTVVLKFSDGDLVLSSLPNILSDILLESY